VVRGLLRVASIGLAGGASFGVVFGGFYMLKAIESWNGPRMAGLLAGWAVIVWAISGLVAGFAIWSWRARFKPAAIGMAIAGVISAYWAIQYLGHDLTPWPSIALGLVAVIVLTSVAAACTVSLRERRIGDRGQPDSN
jgi:hypothetical protein